MIFKHWNDNTENCGLPLGYQMPVLKCNLTLFLHGFVVFLEQLLKSKVLPRKLCVVPTKMFKILAEFPEKPNKMTTARSSVWEY